MHLTNDSYMNSNETDKQTIDRSKITAQQQLTNHYNFHVLTTNHITTKLTYKNQDQRHKYHHLTTTLHLPLKMTTAQVDKTSVTNNCISKDYLHPDDPAKQITDTPGFKPFTIIPRDLTQHSTSTAQHKSIHAYYWAFAYLNLNSFSEPWKHHQWDVRTRRRQLDMYCARLRLRP